jgi:hypothetical protein
VSHLLHVLDRALEFPTAAPVEIHAFVGVVECNGGVSVVYCCFLPREVAIDRGEVWLAIDTPPFPSPKFTIFSCRVIFKQFFYKYTHMHVPKNHTQPVFTHTL